MCLSSVAALEIQLHTQQLKAKIVGRLQLFVGTPASVLLLSAPAFCFPPFSLL
jgi:hypothetical protein